MYREFNRDLFVEHIHAKFDPNISPWQHGTHIHHCLLVEHSAKVYGLGMHSLKGINRRRSIRGQAAYHGLCIFGPSEGVSMYPSKDRATPNKLYRVAYMLPKSCGRWWTVPCQSLRQFQCRHQDVPELDVSFAISRTASIFVKPDIRNVTFVFESCPQFTSGDIVRKIQDHNR